VSTRGKNIFARKDRCASKFRRFHNEASRLSSLAFKVTTIAVTAGSLISLSVYIFRLYRCLWLRDKDSISDCDRFSAKFTGKAHDSVRRLRLLDRSREGWRISRSRPLLASRVYLGVSRSVMIAMDNKRMPLIKCHFAVSRSPLYRSHLIALSP